MDMSKKDSIASRVNISANGIVLDTFDLHIKGKGIDHTLPVCLFENYQRNPSVWGEFDPKRIPSLQAQEVEIDSDGKVNPFRSLLEPLKIRQVDGDISFYSELLPLREPIESSDSAELKQVTFALLDSPLTQRLVRDQQKYSLDYRYDIFQIQLTPPSTEHKQISDRLGQSPHALTHSGAIKDPNGRTFTSTTAREALISLHDALSFAAGRWAGIVLVRGLNAKDEIVWFRYGTGPISNPGFHLNWYDPKHPEWLQPLLEAIHKRKLDKESWEPIRKAIYWYIRSNTLEAGSDSSLILSQCALELLSWDVIVQETHCLSEEGYGQLRSASERLHLALSLLGIPSGIPKELKILNKAKDWSDLTRAIIQARNYLVHPTEPRTGRQNKPKQYPWGELWLAAQWLLECMILRILGYSKGYRNRIQRTNAIEQVPWSSQYDT